MLVFHIISDKMPVAVLLTFIDQEQARSIDQTGPFVILIARLLENKYETFCHDRQSVLNGGRLVDQGD